MSIILTGKASDRLKEIIKAKGEGLALRVMVRDGARGIEYGMALDPNPRPDDDVTENDGVKVVVDPVSLQFLDGSIIDYVVNASGEGFSIDNPNAAKGGGCGCGGGGGGCGCGGGQPQEEQAGCGSGGGCG